MWITVDLHGFYGPGAEKPAGTADALAAGLIVMGCWEQRPGGFLGTRADIWATRPGCRAQACNVSAGWPLGGIYDLPHLRYPQILQWEEYRQLATAVREVLFPSGFSLQDVAAVGMLGDWLGDHGEPDAGAYYEGLYWRLRAPGPVPVAGA